MNAVRGLRSFGLFLSAVSLAALVGCGGGETSKVVKVPTVPVKGSVVLDGTSPGEVLLEFRPLAATAPGATTLVSTARVSADGSFTVRTYEDGDGAPPGKYTVHMLPLDSTSGAGKQAKPVEIEIENKADGVELSITLESIAGAKDPLLKKPS